MGETGGTDRVLPTAGTRLGAQPPMGVSTLEPGHMPSPRTQEKHLHVRVKLLDCTVEAFDMEPRCDGQTLLTQLWERLHLLESDYFGLEFQNGPSSWVWLEPTKPIVRQVRRPKSALFRLAVKFFPPDPGQLREEYTRYLFALQLKRDLLEERLPCASTTAALLTSHFLQAEVGDYDEAVDREHLGTHVYLPGQGPCLEKTLEFHRRHTGQTPAESDFQVLEIARKLEMYGIRFHTASDREGTKINLAVSHMGVLVFQGTTKINTFNWSKVRKLSFKRRRFLIKLHPEVHGPYQDTLEFLLGSRDACKNFWKICVEHHTFFRLLAQPKPKAKAVLFSRGSSFRYSGRTQRQLVEYVKDGGAARLPYERRHSKAGPSVRALTTDLPKQSISFNESLRTSSWSSANTCFYPLPASPPARPSPPGLKDSSGSTPEPPGPAAEKSSMAVVAGPSPQPASQPGPPAPPSGPGGNSCPVLSSRGSVRAGGQRLGALDRDAGRGLECRAACAGDGGEGTFSTGPGPAGGGQWCHWQRCGGGPVFTSTSTPLQVSEEFIDDDPADISFFAGSSEAFSFLYGSWVTQEPRGPAWSPAGPPLRGPGVSQHPQSTQSSPDTCSMEAADRSVENDFDFEEESDFDGDVHLAATSELLEVKAQASLMHSLLSPSECSSLPDVQLQGGPSETSSMANFPACSVRSDASSALQFSDVLEQLGQLNYPPPAAQGSSSSDSDSWDSGAEAPLNVGLFLSRPFA